MSMTREELFAIAKKTNSERRANATNKKNYNNVFESTVYSALTTASGRTVRILGNPLSVREKPTDPKRTLISMILGDDGKKFRCIWPLKEDNKNWLLWKIYNLVMAYKGQGTGEDYTKLYFNQKAHPECFNRVAKNNSTHQLEQGWRPTQFVHINILDRHDPDFHIEHKHSKVLSKKASEIQNSGSFWYEPGVPITVYNSIWDSVAEYYGDWENYDVVIRKLGAQPWYEAFHGLEERKKLTPEESKYIVEGPLTELERSYELYDFDKIFAVTTYTKIKNKLGDFIRKVDFDFKTNFTDELEKLVAEEKTKWDAEKAKEDAKEDAKEEAKKKFVVKEIKEEPQPQLKTRSPRIKQDSEVKKESIPWDKLIDGTFNGKKYLGIEKMTDEEKAEVVSVNDDGSFVYKTTTDILMNTNSNFASPSSFKIDPLSGEEF